MEEKSPFGMDEREEVVIAAFLTRSTLILIPSYLCTRCEKTRDQKAVASIHDSIQGALSAHGLPPQQEMRQLSYYTLIIQEPAIALEYPSKAKFIES